MRTSVGNLMAEDWRSIPGYDGFKASSLGRIKGKTGRIVGCFKAKYVMIGMGYGKSSVCRHRLIAAAFLPPPPFENAEIDHIDRNKHNDCPTNLRWTNRFDNMENRAVLSHSSSKIKGLKWLPPDPKTRQVNGRWRGTIQYKKIKHVKYFRHDQKEQAIEWLNETREKLKKESLSSN